MIETLHQQVERLNRSSGVSYQIMLAGLLARHGHVAVARALVASCTGNVISIAAAPRWCRPRQGPGRKPTSGKPAA
jgi:hypothetical protein